MLCLMALTPIALSNDKEFDHLSTAIGATLILGTGYYVYNKYISQAPVSTSEKPQQLHDSPKIIPQEPKKISHVDLKIENPSDNNQKQHLQLSNDKPQDELPKRLIVTPPIPAENTDELTSHTLNNDTNWREVFGNSFAKITSDHLYRIVWE